MRREFETFYRLHPELKRKSIIVKMAERMKISFKEELYD